MTQFLAYIVPSKVMHPNLFSAQVYTQPQVQPSLYMQAYTMTGPTIYVAWLLGCKCCSGQLKKAVTKIMLVSSYPHCKCAITKQGHLMQQDL